MTQNRSGNKGEWSELLVFLKLLAEGKLYAADAELNKIEDIYYNIIKILRSDNGEPLEYFHDSKIIIKNQEGETINEVPLSEFKENSVRLLEKIKQTRGSSFSFQEIEGFLREIKISKLKSSSQLKRDISLVVHDPNAGYNPELGFSIKSMLGSPSTLLNAGKTTNFIYRIQGAELSKSQIKEINDLTKFKDKIEKLISFGGRIEYYDMERDSFKLNLQIIDSQFPIVVSEMLKIFYGEGISSVKDLTERIKSLNPCKFDQSLSHKFYEVKVKNMLTSAALGMVPSKVWDDEYDATGGYIIVKGNGEVLCYHIYNREQFREYLLNNTRLEVASTTRHNFGKVYKEEDKYFIKLNLQIRFIK